MSSTFAKLIARDALVPPREIALTEFPIRLGRSAEADICIEDRWVSREHCEIECVDQVLRVRDLGSKHGTFVNGRAVSAAVLKPGDQLSVGLSVFLVQYEYESAATEVSREAVV
jgi:pSer/pThr/pTyr-binding forkhead associated (FHA) protein